MRLESKLPGSGSGSGGGGGGSPSSCLVNLFRTEPTTSSAWAAGEVGRTYVRTAALDDLNRPAALASVQIQVEAAPGGDYTLTEMCVGELDPADPIQHLGSTFPVLFNGAAGVTVPAGQVVLSDPIQWPIDLSVFNGFWFGFTGTGHSIREDSRPDTGGAYQSGGATCANIAMSDLSKVYLVSMISGIAQ